MSILNQITSNKFIKNLFIFLNKKNCLKIVKGNKHLMEINDINLKNYKDYYEKYFTVELTIIPVKDFKGPIIKELNFSPGIIKIINNKSNIK